MSEGDARPQGNPDIDRLTHLPLYEGQRVKHELVYGVVKDRNTGEFHHDYASFRTLRKTKASPWKPDPRASFTLSDDKAGELTAALNFLASSRAAGGQSPLVAPVAELEPADKLDLVLQLLRQLREDLEPRQLMALLEAIDDGELAATERLFEIAVWRRSLREFHRLLKDPESTPGEYCAHFLSYPWLIGDEASEVLTPPAFDEDVLLLRTADNWLELVLLRTPLADAHLFHGDAESWFPVPELQMALARTQALLERLHPEELLITEDWTLQGLRARILIGHLHGDPVQEQALQRFNRHSRRIEVLSFDMVDRAAIRALKRLQAAGKESGI